MRKGLQLDTPFIGYSGAEVAHVTRGVARSGPALERPIGIDLGKHLAPAAGVWILAVDPDRYCRRLVHATSVSTEDKMMPLTCAVRTLLTLHS